MHQCCYCSKIANDLLHCSRCKYSHYCNKGCQLADWTNHKTKCSEITKQYSFIKNLEKNAEFVSIVCSTAAIIASYYNENTCTIVITKEDDLVIAEIVNESLQSMFNEDDTGLLKQTFSDAVGYNGVLKMIWTYGHIAYGSSYEITDCIEQAKKAQILISDIVLVTLKNDVCKVELLRNDKLTSIEL